MASLKGRVLRAVGHTGYRRFIVLTRSRTGSNLLVSFLDSHPNVRALGEIVRVRGKPHIDIIDAAFGKAPRRIRAKGFKVFYYHPVRENNRAMWEYLAAMDGLHVIHLKRRNILRSTVSQKIAMNAGVWKTKNPGSIQAAPRKQVSFTVDELERRFAATRKWERDGDALFQDHPMLTIHYEDLVADTGATFGQVTDFLGVPYVEPRSALVRQNPEPIRALISNYDELLAAFRGTEWEPFFHEPSAGLAAGTALVEEAVG